MGICVGVRVCLKCVGGMCVWVCVGLWGIYECGMFLLCGDISVELSVGISKVCVWMCVYEGCIKCVCVCV